MLTLKWKVKEVAQRKGISSAAQLAQRVDIAPGTATSLWYGRQLRVDLSILTRICIALECGPGDVLVFEEDGQKDRVPGQIAALVA